MNLKDILKLVALSAIWGGSFIFMRILAPVLGAIPTANLRILIAGFFLVSFFSFKKLTPECKLNWKLYLVIGLVNSAIPFSLYAFGALSIPASYEVIINSTAPIFGAIFSAIWLQERLTAIKITGLIFAAIGVGLVVNIDVGNISIDYLTAIIACLLAALCYGLGGIYIKKFAGHLDSKMLAGGSQLSAGIVLLPLTMMTKNFHVESLFVPKILFCLLGIALICSALAYLLYYQLQNY